MNMNERFMQKTIVIWLGALLCCALWGSAFPCIKIGYKLFGIESNQTATQILFAGSRFILAGVLVLMISSLLNRRMLVPKKKSYARIIKLSMLQTVAQYLFFYIGLAHTTGVKASIIGAVNVFVAIFVACMCFHQERISGRKLMGSLIGFSGVVLVNLSGNSLDVHLSMMGEGCIFLSTIAYAFSSVLIKIYSKDENPVCLSAYQFIFGGLLMSGVGFILGGRILVITAQGLAMLGYLAVVSVVAYTIWGILLKYNPISKVAVFGFMNPVFGFLLSAFLLNEYQSLNMFSMISLVLVCIGIYIVNMEKD